MGPALGPPNWGVSRLYKIRPLLSECLVLSMRHLVGVEPRDTPPDAFVRCSQTRVGLWHSKLNGSSSSRARIGEGMLRHKPPSVRATWLPGIVHPRGFAS